VYYTAKAVPKKYYGKAVVKHLAGLCGVLILASIVTNATAATIADDAMFSFGGSAIASDCCDYGATSAHSAFDFLVKLDKFDPALGILTDVTFNLTSVLQTNPNFSPFSLFVTGWAAGNGEFHSVAESVFTTRIIDPVTNILFENGFIDQVQISHTNGFRTAETTMHAGAINNASFIPLSLTGYQGTGQYDVILSQILDVSVTPLLALGKAEASLSGRWSGSLEVVYSFSEVPVPAAFWLFGSALAGLGWLHRKKTAKLM